MLMSAVGFAILISEHNKQGVRYFAVFLPVMAQFVRPLPYLCDLASADRFLAVQHLTYALLG